MESPSLFEVLVRKPRSILEFALEHIRKYHKNTTKSTKKLSMYLTLLVCNKIHHKKSDLYHYHSIGRSLPLLDEKYIP